MNTDGERHKKHAALPESLRHLQPFANALAKLSPEKRNEDVDPSRLETALRKRIRGLNPEAAQVLLEEDRDRLEHWLKDKPDHPAHWILGFTRSPNLAADLMQPPEAPPRGPKMFFEPPTGWSIKAVPFRLDLRARKVIGSIVAIDEFTFQYSLGERALITNGTHPGDVNAHEMSDVVLPGCSGKKFLYQCIAPLRWKRVDYLLRVSGGFVWIQLTTMTGAAFDESPLESRLHTLRISHSQ